MNKLKPDRKTNAHVNSDMYFDGDEDLKNSGSCANQSDGTRS